MNRTAPLDLPRLVMRRALGVSLCAMLLAAVLGLLRANQNIEEEVDAAMGLAQVVARLGALPQLDDREAMRQLREALAAGPVRHLDLTLHDAHGHVLLRPAPPDTDADASPLAALYTLHRAWRSEPDRRRAAWTIPRPTGGAWTISLTPSHESERVEALSNLAAALALLLASIALLLAVMAWNVRRAFRPLAGLLAAIERMEHRDGLGVQHLPTMPIRELEAIAAALRHLVQALDGAEAGRRVLSQKMLTLQEDERSHLARELHDEFGQRLTALRLDAAWLTRQLAGRPEAQAVAQAMADRCGEVQRDIRDLLLRLRPLGPVGAEPPDAPLSLARLAQLLQDLVQGWPRGGLQIELRLLHSAGSTPPRPLTPAESEQTALPRGLALAVYRLSQEAVTNAARHAHARGICLELRLQDEPMASPQPGTCLIWTATDDGIGIDRPAEATPRGNGLAGMQERVWALGGTWSWGRPDRPAPGGPGLQLRARLPLAASHPLP
jgi:two-component system, NarL family, sensor histidine kinase UhpB